MKDSIVVDMKYADYDMIDNSRGVERHHLYFGNGRRQVADEIGAWIPLSKSHHTEGNKPDKGVRCDVHHCVIFDTLAKQLGQACYERNWIAEHAQDGISADVLLEEARARFRALVGKSYL